MTISDQVTSALYTATGASPNFTFNHPVRTSAEITVTKKPLATGIEVPLVLGVDYTVTGTPDANNFYPNGLTVVMTVTPLNGDKISIVRSTNRTQTSQYSVADKFPAASHEASLDKLTMQVQEQQSSFSKVPQFPSTSTATNVKMPDPIDGRGIYFDSASNSYKNTDVALNALTTTAAASAAAAAVSASNAAVSATNAGTSATNASNSATSANTSATNASNSAAAAAASAASLNLRTINNQAGAYTIIASDRNKLVQLTSGTFTFGFTAAATLGSGFELEVRNAGAGTLTLDPNGAELIDGVSTIQLATMQAVVLVCDGTQWLVTQSYGYGGAAVTYATSQDVITATSTTKAMNPAVAAVPFRKGQDIASAATITLPNSSSNVGGFHDITGTTNIGGITQSGPYLGREVELRFNGNQTLLNNGVSFPLLGNADIVTRQYDTARFRCIDTTNNYWQMISYSRYNGAALLDFPYAKLTDVKTSGTAGGTPAALVWNTRDLNTKVVDGIGITLASNQFTLPAGTYKIDATCTAVGGGISRSKLYSITAAADVLVGETTYSNNNSANIQARTDGYFTITASTVFEMRHYVGVNTGTLGVASNIAGYSETYSAVRLWKIA